MGAFLGNYAEKEKEKLRPEKMELFSVRTCSVCGYPAVEKDYPNGDGSPFPSMACRDRGEKGLSTVGLRKYSP